MRTHCIIFKYYLYSIRIVINLSQLNKRLQSYLGMREIVMWVLGKLAPHKIRPDCKTYMEKTRPLENLSEHFLTVFFTKQCSVQIFRSHCRQWANIIAMDEMTILSKYHWWSADIDKNQTCQCEAYWNAIGTNCTCGPFASRYHLNAPLPDTKPISDMVRRFQLHS